jgi:hypothetical protein
MNTCVTAVRLGSGRVHTCTRTLFVHGQRAYACMHATVACVSFLCLSVFLCLSIICRVLGEEKVSLYHEKRASFFSGGIFFCFLGPRLFIVQLFGVSAVLFFWQVMFGSSKRLPPGKTKFLEDELPRLACCRCNFKSGDISARCVGHVSANCPLSVSSEEFKQDAKWSTCRDLAPLGAMLCTDINQTSIVLGQCE